MKHPKAQRASIGQSLTCFLFCFGLFVSIMFQLILFLKVNFVFPLLFVRLDISSCVCSHSFVSKGV